MRIRSKLLVLLLVIAFLPLLTVIWFDLHATRQVGRELSERARQILAERAADQLLLAVRGSAEILRRERALLEAAVQQLAREAEQSLRAGLGEETLEGLVPAMERLRGHEAAQAAWLRVTLVGGRMVTFPPDAPALGPTPQWTGTSSAAPGPLWHAPIVQDGTGLALLSVSAPITGADGSLLGTAAIDVPVATVLSSLATADRLEPSHALLARLVEDPGGGGAIEAIAGYDSRSVEPARSLLRESQAEGLGDVVTDMAAGRPNVRHVQLDGQDTLWAYGSIDDMGTHLLLIVPYREVVAEIVEAQGYVFESLAWQRNLLLVSAAMLVPALVVLAVFASRAVTRPVHQLAQAARQLASGDFNARAHIRSGDEMEELGRLFNMVVPQLDKSFRMRESLALAQEVQQNLLPTAAPKIPGLDLAGTSIYCDETGGDYFDFFALPEVGPHAVAVAVGDVAGHGIAAALLMTTARALLRSQEPAPGRLSGLMTDVNRNLAKDIHAGRFMTMFLAVLDSGSRSVHWVNAGHAPGVVYEPRSRRFREIGGVDIPLGIEPDWVYHELAQSGWDDDAVIMIGTDGVWETRDTEGRMFGRDRAHDLLAANAHLPAADIVAAITDALAAFRGERPQEDDITLVVMKAI